MICLVAFFTPVINGSYIGIALIRYNFHALVLGSAGFTYVLMLLAESLNIKERIISYTGYLITFGMLILLSVTWLKSDVKSGLKDYFNCYPERSMVLDQLKDEYDLTYGIADYWQAKFSTTFSRNGIRLYAANDGDFRPFYHVTNENWFHDGGKGVHKNPIFNYVVTDAYKNTDKLLEIFGSDMDTIYNQNNIMVVKVPGFKFDRKTKEIYLIE